MTRISFYILKSSQEHDRQVFACRLIEKAHAKGNQIYIHADSQEQANQFNDLLWSFRSDSFVPHQLMYDTSQTTQDDCPILIGHESTPPRLMNLLINLSSEQPIFFSQFERVAEFINDNETTKALGRERYQFYKERGYELESHKL